MLRNELANANGRQETLEEMFFRLTEGQSEVRDQRSEIRDPQQSEVRSQMSEIKNPPPDF